mgnify:CR=1 FL=1
MPSDLFLLSTYLYNITWFVNNVKYYIASPDLILLSLSLNFAIFFSIAYFRILTDGVLPVKLARYFSNFLMFIRICNSNIWFSLLLHSYYNRRRCGVKCKNANSAEYLEAWVILSRFGSNSNRKRSMFILAFYNSVRYSHKIPSLPKIIRLVFISMI